MDERMSFNPSYSSISVPDDLDLWLVRDGLQILGEETERVASEGLSVAVMPSPSRVESLCKVQMGSRAHSGLVLEDNDMVVVQALG